MMVLDTDHISVLQHRQSRQADELRTRLRGVIEDVVTTVATYEEQLRSWLNLIGKHSDVEDQVPFYHRLRQFADFYAEWELLPFADEAALTFKRLRHQRIRISTSDLKIASIVLVHDATLLTRNVSDFEQIPGLRVETWI